MLILYTEYCTFQVRSEHVMIEYICRHFLPTLLFNNITFISFWLWFFRRLLLSLHNVSAIISSSLPQVSLVYLGIKMIQPRKLFLKFSRLNYFYTQINKEYLMKAGGCNNQNIVFQVITIKIRSTVQKITTKIIHNKPHLHLTYTDIKLLVHSQVDIKSHEHILLNMMLYSCSLRFIVTRSSSKEKKSPDLLKRKKKFHLAVF